MEPTVLVSFGDVIDLGDEDCKVLKNASIGLYVVEEATQSGGWLVLARRLSENGFFASRNPSIEFHQCPGYTDSLLSPVVVGHMTRIFV